LTQQLSSGIRRAEVIAAISLAGDLASGEEPERSIRSCLVAQRIGAATGYTHDQLSDAYYVSMLRWLGCTADSHVAAQAFGDEFTVGPWIAPAKGDGPLAVMAAMLKNHGAGQPFPRRAGMLLTAFANSPKVMKNMAAHCEVAQALAKSMGFNDRVQLQLGQVNEVWNGSGVHHLKGEQIDPVVRLITFAEDMQLFHRLGGIPEALEVATRRTGKAYDPRLCAVFIENAASCLEPLEESASWHRVLDVEPQPQIVLSEDEIEQTLCAVADFCDLKSPFTPTHCRDVAALAEAAARHCSLPPREVETLRRAALVHEVGLVGISSSIVEKTTPLTEVEFEKMRLHPYYAERVFANQPYLATLGTLAAMHHEHTDGSGYHRGLPGSAQPLAARLLAAACAYATATEGRANQAALSPEDAAAELGLDAERGYLDPDAVRAVFAAAGHRAPAPAPQTWPARLSDREVEVLRLMARGMSRKQIGSQLFIADKTVARHIEHIYDKIGVNTRPGATVFAMQQGLLQT
jgi:HD-GYP domain-containing protein (c-di-GMP phosphodiesterase class II)